MSKKQRLRPEIKAFFSLVHGAILANPFDDERIDADLKISGLPATISRKKRLEKTIYEVKKQIKRFEADGPTDIHAYPEEDKRLIQAAFLFDFFYQYPRDYLKRS